MYTSPFSEVLAALSADAIARLQKGEPLDKVAADLYAKLAEVEGTLVLKSGDAALYQDIATAVADRVVACVDKIEKIEQERSDRVKLARPSAQVNTDTSWVPRTPLDRAIKALQDAQRAAESAGTNEEGASATAALESAKAAYQTAMCEHLALRTRLRVLTRLETALTDEIVKQRMHDCPADRIAKLEEKLLATVSEAAELGGNFAPCIIAAGG